MINVKGENFKLVEVNPMLQNDKRNSFYWVVQQEEQEKRTITSKGSKSFRSKVVSIETNSQFDRRVNDYKNYSFASV